MSGGANSALAQSSIDKEPFSAERYFATQQPPANLAETLDGVRQFVIANRLNGRRIVLVTVRFILSSLFSRIGAFLVILTIEKKPSTHIIVKTFWPAKSGGTTVPLELNV